LRELKPLDPNAESPEDVWFDYFEKRRPNRRTVRELVFNLHEKRKHEHVIALIEAALSHGHVYSWMYEVLAISYEIVGGPEADEKIERALTSAVDPSVDFESIMFSSAYLSRFNNKRPALRMYRQASLRNPVRPEPYVLGMRLARELKDVDAIQWAVVGILNYAWNDGHEKLHQQALVAKEEALNLLTERGDKQRAEKLRKTVSEALIRDLVIEIRWNGKSDVDLAVEGPKGTTADWENTHTIAGGVHVHDGYGPKQQNCYEKYVCVKAFPGRYLVRVNHVWGNIVAGRVSVKVTKYQGTQQETVQKYSLQLTDKNRAGYVNVTLERGRRKELVDALRDNRQSRLELWRNPFRQSRRNHVGPTRLTSQQRQVLQQFLGGGQGNQFGGGFITPAAIGFTPTITPIFEGASMGASAVVSGDRRYVRIGINATFQSIVDVFNYSLSNGSSMRTNGN